MTNLDSQIEELIKENAELKARNTLLIEKIIRTSVCDTNNTGNEPSLSVFHRELDELLMLAKYWPKKCLNSVKADAIDEATNDCVSMGFMGAGVIEPQKMFDYADKLRANNG